MKNNASASAIPENPQVLIKYEPETALSVLGNDGQKTLAKLEGVKTISSQQSLATATKILDDAQVVADRMETFRSTLCEKVAQAASRFRDYPGFEDIEVSVTIRRWGLRQKLADACQFIRTARANFLAAEDRKQREEQQRRDAEQERKNREEAERAAKAAKKAGADEETQQSIRQDVLNTPAPLVQPSRAVATARAAGVGLQYRWYAKITDLRAFLEYCLKNETMFNTLKGAAEAEIEDAFHKMAANQHERFSYPGITFEKLPVDVRRKGRR